MTAKKYAYVLLLALVIVLPGCLGTGADEDDSQGTSGSDNHSTSAGDWINERGTGTTSMWNISLTENQWLEVKSSEGIIDGGGGDSQQTSMVIIEDGNWMSVSGFSPIFGGNYSMCILYIEGQCYNTDPEGDGNWELIEWSIIYRIHDV